MKKMNNKGFSLVELIIVIAIMAILAGALAPALLRYIEKTRVSNDKTTAANMKTAVETGLANEEVMEAVADKAGTANFLLFKVTPATKTAAASYDTAKCPAVLQTEIEQTLASKKLRIKSKKDLKQEIWVAIALGGAGEADVVEVYLVQSDGQYLDTQGDKLAAAPTRANLISTAANNNNNNNNNQTP